MSYEMHQIGEVADLVGLSLRTIRHYDEVDLVPPSGRTSGGFRLYTDDDIERLRFVRGLKPLGFTLEQMRQVLTLRERFAAAGRGTDDEARLRDELARFAAMADERCDELRRQLRTCEALADLLRHEARGRPAVSPT